MNDRDALAAEFDSLDAGRLLPGCSVPVYVSDDGVAVHSFKEFRPLPFDGLNATSKRGLADSMIDVIVAMDRMHQEGCCYGRISSRSFHNRGSDTAPRATLWIDPELSLQSDAVHAGDPESIYWTPERLQSGETPKRSDDWYALGVVLAELQLSSAAVHRIWELSRQDGQFAETLLKNLRRSRGDRKLKSMASTLIRGGAAGELDAMTIAKLTQRPTGTSFRSAAAFLIAAGVLVAASGWMFVQGRNERDRYEQQIAMLQEENGQLIAAAESPKVTTFVPQPQPVVQSSTKAQPGVEDRDRWKEEIAGRSLADAIAASAAQPISDSALVQSWREMLLAIESIDGQEQWRESDATVRRLVQQVINTPWEVEPFSMAQSRFTSLNNAYARWKNWADSTKTIDEIKTQHSLMPAGVTKDLHGQWLAEALEVNSFDLLVVASAGGDQDGWTSHLVGFESETASDSAEWEWDAAEGELDSLRLKVTPYRAGDELTFWVKQDSAIPLWDSTVIKHSFKSPLLVWQLARELRVEGNESGYVVLLTTNTNFGPPPRLRTTRRDRPQVLERPVVDPLDDLPLGIK